MVPVSVVSSVSSRSAAAAADSPGSTCPPGSAAYRWARHSEARYVGVLAHHTLRG
ncbi:hypothetical protein ACFV9C_11395 [Kribbella sp. NPDC059898]|uniref:hypothetical protein n=1 Tax=Kribbella sp. NPDC059898 TaxID=3346995 RepID=UPI0036617572